MANSAIIPSAQVRSFRELVVWQEAMDLTVLVHQAATRHSRKVYRLHVAIAR